MTAAALPGWGALRLSRQAGRAQRGDNPSRTRLRVPTRSLVVLAGLPGAGKTRLWRRLASPRPADVLALDAEQVAETLRSAPLPYAALRPFVHAWHLLRVARALRTSATCVLTTDPMTSRLQRLMLRTVAALTGRSLHVVLVDATAREAVLGQYRRGRTVSRRRMLRHVRRWRRMRAEFTATAELTGASSTVLIDRATARRAVLLAVGDGPEEPA